jgi:hypothetical protein
VGVKAKQSTSQQNASLLNQQNLFLTNQSNEASNSVFQKLTQQPPPPPNLSLQPSQMPPHLLMPPHQSTSTLNTLNNNSLFQQPPSNINVSNFPRTTSLPLQMSNGPPISQQQQQQQPLLPLPNQFQPNLINTNQLIRPKDQMRFNNQIPPPQFQQSQPRMPLTQPNQRPTFSRTQSQNRFNTMSINTNETKSTNYNSSAETMISSNQQNEKEMPNSETPNGDVQEEANSKVETVESNLVKYYLNLNESKDEANFIQNTESTITQLHMPSPTSANNEDQNLLDDYLSSQFNPFTYEVKPSQCLKSTRLPILTKYESYLLTKQSEENDLVEFYLNKETFKKLFINESSENEKAIILSRVDLKLLDNLLNDLDSNRLDKSFSLFDGLCEKSKFMEKLIEFILNTLNSNFLSISCCNVVKSENLRELNDISNKENSSSVEKIIANYDETDESSSHSSTSSGSSSSSGGGSSESESESEPRVKIKKIKLNEQKKRKQEEKLKRKHLKNEYKQTNVKLRQFKLAFSYLHLILTKYGKNVAAKIIDHKIQLVLIDVLDCLSENELMGVETSFRLKCLSCLNKTLLFKYGIDQFVNDKLYSRILNNFAQSKVDTSKKLTTRIGLLISTILSKVK